MGTWHFPIKMPIILEHFCKSISWRLPGCRAMRFDGLKQTYQIKGILSGSSWLLRVLSHPCLPPLPMKHTYTHTHSTKHKDQNLYFQVASEEEVFRSWESARKSRSGKEPPNEIFFHLDNWKHKLKQKTYLTGEISWFISSDYQDRASACKIPTSLHGFPAADRLQLKGLLKLERGASVRGALPGYLHLVLYSAGSALLLEELLMQGSCPSTRTFSGRWL